MIDFEKMTDLEFDTWCTKSGPFDSVNVGCRLLRMKLKALKRDHVETLKALEKHVRDQRLAAEQLLGG